MHNSPGLPDGTYELIGPKIQGNPEGFPVHTLVAHSDRGLRLFGSFAPERTFAAIRGYLEHAGIEGIVWHHEDGRMVKIKRKDFFKG
jgi:hypothetical protein